MFVLYISLTVPVLTVLLILMVTRLPDLLSATWYSFLIQHGAFSHARGEGHLLGMVLSAAQIAVLALPVFATVYLLYALSRAPLRAMWNWSRPSGSGRK